MEAICDLLASNLSLTKGRCNARHNLELENSVAEVKSSIINDYEESCLLKYTIHSRDVPWWNNNFTKLRSETQRLFNICKRTNERSDYRTPLTMYIDPYHRKASESYGKR